MNNYYCCWLWIALFALWFWFMFRCAAFFTICYCSALACPNFWCAPWMLMWLEPCLFIKCWLCCSRKRAILPWTRCSLRAGTMEWDLLSKLGLISFAFDFWFLLAARDIVGASWLRPLRIDLCYRIDCPRLMRNSPDLCSLSCSRNWLFWNGTMSR